jgi:predicted MFS family arabinose efflux permease
MVLLLMGLLDALPGLRWWLLGGAMVLAVLFAWRELSFGRPFLDLRLLGGNRPLLLVYLGFVVFSAVYYFAFFGLPQLLQEAGGYDPGRFGVRRVLIAGVVLLTVAAAGLWLLTASFAVLLVLALTALMGVPYGSVSIASNQGLYLSAAPQDRGVAAGIFQTCRYVGAISATVMIGIFYGNGVNQENWGRMVLAMLGLCAVTFVVALLWRERRAG